MQLASNQILCETCGTVYTVSVGNSVTCPICQRTLTLSAIAQQPAPAATVVPNASPGGAPMARPVTHGAPTANAPLATPAGGPMPPHLADPTNAATPHAVGQTMSIVPKPISPKSDDGNQDAETVARPPSGARGLLWVVGATTIVLLLVGGSLAIYLARPDLFRKSQSEKAARAEVIVDVPRQDNGPTKWHEVSNANRALRLDGVKVRVERVEFGEVLAKDARHHVHSSEGKNFLQIYLHIQNQRGEDLQYFSWYGNTFREMGRSVIARLTDDQGRDYQMMTFGDVTAIKGHVPTAKLIAKPTGPQVNYVEDVLIYDLPGGTAPTSVKYFRLELPAAAFGGRRAFHFQIPISRMQSYVRPTFE